MTACRGRVGYEEVPDGEERGHSVQSDASLQRGGGGEGGGRGMDDVATNPLTDDYAIDDDR